MVIITSILLFLIFLFLSSIHFYWAFGGRWGSGSVFPTKDDNVKPNMPGFMPTFSVAVVLLAITMFMLQKSTMLTLSIPAWINEYGLIILASVFMIRAVGDFNYVGFFKKIKHTCFGTNDTKFYSPLCLVIALLMLVLQICG